MRRQTLPCPTCRESGNDNSGDNLVLFADGRGGYCHRCGKYHRVDGGEVRTYTKEKDQSTTLGYIASLPIEEIESRGISKTICERFEVRSTFDEVTGKQDAVYYPYFNEDGSLTGYKKRELPKSFSVIGKQKRLFGQKACKDKAKFLIIVEGEQDCLAVAEMLHQMGKNYNVVSIPNGANQDGKVDSETMRQIEWMCTHESIAICFDDDTPGKATALALADHLASQSKVGIVKLPMHDANDMLMAGRGSEFFKCLQSAKQYHPESVVEGQDVSLEELKKPKKPGVDLPFPRLQKMTWGLRKAEITLLTAGSGLGKSTFAREIAYDLALKGFRVATIGLETTMEDTVRYYIAMDNNVPAHKLMFNPDCIPEEAYAESYNKLIKSNQMHFFKHWGSIASDELIRKCYYYAKALQCDFIILDHISMVVAGQESTNERKDIDTLFEALARLVVETGIGVVPIMHLKRVNGKSFNKGDEVELTDLRGSAGAEQMSFNVWALERDQQGDQKDLVKIRVLKNRLLGFTGEADTLRYDHSTGRLLTLQTDY